MVVQVFHLQPTEGDIIQFINEVTCSFSDLSEMKNIALFLYHQYRKLFYLF
jgi:hypothetical protein